MAISALTEAENKELRRDIASGRKSSVQEELTPYVAPHTAYDTGVPATDAFLDELELRVNEIREVLVRHGLIAASANPAL